MIGSYPFVDALSGPNTNIVIRGRDPARIDAAAVAVEHMLGEVRSQLAERGR